MIARQTFACDAEIAAIFEGLMARTLPKPEWTHAAHFASALWLLAQNPDPPASMAIKPLIRAYNEATGVANTDTEGYHETITQASLRAASAMLQSMPGQPVFVVCNALLESPFGRSEWPLTYWSRPLLFSPGARRAWVEPDIQVLPF